MCITLALMLSKAALITAGANRIGKAMAIRLAKLGYHIILHYNRSKENALKTKNEIEVLGNGCTTVQIDFSDPQKAITLFDDFDQKLDIQIVVNNASDFSKSNFETADNQLLFHHFNITFVSAYKLTKLFAQKKQHGLIVNLLDTKVQYNNTEHLDYLLAKKTLYAFTKIAAKELGPNFRVNAIAPGIILPPPEIDAAKGQAYMMEKAQNIPLKSHGDTNQICNTLQFFIENKFITGQTIFVDGGEHLG